MALAAHEDAKSVLTAELEQICSKYVKYAPQLTRAGITSAIVADDPDEAWLIRHGMTNPVHARHYAAYVIWTKGLSGAVKTQELFRVEDLKQVLEEWSPILGPYAEVLWRHEVTCIDQLAAAGKDMLEEVCEVLAGPASMMAAAAERMCPLRPPQHNSVDITEYAFVRSALPRLQFEVTKDEDKTPSPSKLRYPEPQDVLPWQYVDPLDDSTDLLDEAIPNHIEQADKTCKSLQPPRRFCERPAKYEADYASNMMTDVLDKLHACANHSRLVRSCAGARVAWRQEEPEKIIQAGLAQQYSDTATGAKQHDSEPQAEQSPAPRYSDSGRLQRKRSQSYSNHEQEGGSEGLTSVRCDVVLEGLFEPPNKIARTASEASACHSSLSAARLSRQASLDSAFMEAAAEVTALLPAAHKEFACVGEMKPPSKLTMMPAMQQGSAGDPQPVDLWEALSNPEHPFHKRFRGALAQLYVYMLVTRVCYGFLSCWYVTWLVCCPLGDRGKLYVSAPVLASAVHAPEAPAATTKGALSWLQQRALSSREQRAPAIRWYSAPAAAGDGDDDGDDGDDDEDDAAKSDPAHDDYVPGSKKTSRGASKGRKSSSRSSSSKPSTRQQGHHKKQQKQQTFSAAELQLGGKLCQGSLGAVLAGRYKGAEVVAKLLGPRAAGRQAGRQEHGMYQSMQRVQGHLVPHYYGMGHLGCGVFCLATSRIDGMPLSSLKDIPEAVAAAAVECLQALVAAFPGFVHGDVRLQNVLLLSGGSDRNAQCMFIDFARSRLDGTKEEQKAEQRLLKQLVGMYA